jgi:HSP20 family protein
MAAVDHRQWMWAEACAMIERAEQLHRQFFQPAIATVAGSWEPPVDVFSSERELFVVAALPGVEPEDVKVSIDQDLLVIRGMRQLPAAARGKAVHRLEIPHGHFERRIRLPPVRWSLNRSALQNGCLFATLTKHS